MTYETVESQLTGCSPPPVAEDGAKVQQKIAIIGMACRLPGDATSPSKLWDLCATGRDGWSPIPPDRFDADAYHDADKDKTGRTHVTGGYFLKQDVAAFDAAFFSMSGNLADAMDPQVRQSLECVYEALEDAGVPLDSVSGTNTSVFAGCFSKDYHEIQTRDVEVLPAAFLTGCGTAMLSNRISHFYDLQGPSMSIDTGCSAGLVALHQGSRCILSGDSDMSVVVASNLMLNPDFFVAGSNLNMLGTNGRCYAWDSRAEGYGRGEGIVGLILKPLDAALRDGDHIHALIRQTCVNQDGKTSTITSPSADAQVKLIEDCYRRANLDPAETSYVEAHMTGTQTGDATEAEALARTFGRTRQMGDPVFVGSVKTNVGHTEPVSGLAAVVKTAWTLQKRQIAPNLNYETPNSKIPQEDWKLRVSNTITVPTSLIEWPKNKPVRASVNSFGYGGTNVHVIMEGAPASATGKESIQNGVSDPTSRIFVLSAKDEAALQNMTRNLAGHIRNLPGSNKYFMSNLAYTLSERRSKLPWRTAVTASSATELADRLEQSPRKLYTSKQPRLGYVFNGQGAQWYAMGRELIKAYPIFGSSILKADGILKAYGASWSLHEELMRDDDSTRVSHVNLSQPVTVALQLALVDLLESWGIRPSAVTSHSSGEIAAGYVVGALSFKDALGVAYFRGELAMRNKQLSALRGGMMAVGLGSGELVKYITGTSEGKVVVACINSPSSVTLSGDVAALDEVATRLKENDIFARKLNVPLAYHSHHMLCMAEEYTQRLQEFLPGKPDGDRTTTARFVSPVTGETVQPPVILTAEHWMQNLTNPVLFGPAFEKMCFGPNGTAEVDLIVEIGAHGTLAGPIRQILNGREIPYVSCLRRAVDAVETMQALGCQLLDQGYPVHLAAVNSPLGSESHSFMYGLPTYPWSHGKRYWAESRGNQEYRFRKLPPQELLGNLIPGTKNATPTWRNYLRLSDIEWLVDHKINSEAVLPGAAYVCMAVESVRLITDHSEKSIQGYRLRDIDIINALQIPEDSAGIETQFSLRKCNEKELDHTGWCEFELSSINTSGSWVENCSGYVAVVTSTKGYDVQDSPDDESFIPSGGKSTQVDVESLFSGLREMGFTHGPMFQNLIDSHTSGSKAITNIKIFEAASAAKEYVIHPTTLDSIIQATYGVVSAESRKGFMVIPRSIKTMFISPDLGRHSGDQLRAYTELLSSTRKGYQSDTNVANIYKSKPASQFSFHMGGFFTQAVPREEDSGSDDKSLKVCSRVQWEQDILDNVPPNVRNTMSIYLSDNEIAFEKKLLKACYYLIYDAVAELKKREVGDREWYHNVFHDWLKHIVDLGERGALASGSETWSKVKKGIKQRLYDELSAGDVSGELTVRVGSKLVSIISGEITPLELMMEDNLLNRYYVGLPRLIRSYAHLAKIIELYAVKSPGARVLEIGSGTGGATTSVLKAFGARGDGSGSLLGGYTFTDISTGFFEAARKQFLPWEGIMEFKKLDIEQDPLEQSFEAGSYDLVVASMVLHATKSLRKTLSHVRKLLKPGGKLLLVEPFQDGLDMPLIFGTLKGWWLSEEPERKWTPSATRKLWHQALQDTGFSGIDFDIGDCEQDEFRAMNVTLTTAVSTPSFHAPVSVVYVNRPPEAWITQLSLSLRTQLGITPSFESLAEIQPGNKVCIFTEEMNGKPYLHHLDKASFSNVRDLLVKAEGVLWLSCGGILDGPDPLFAQTQGLLRAFRLEDSSKRCVHLDFDINSNPWTVDNIEHLVHVMKANYSADVEIIDVEWEYAVKDSVRHVPRVYPDDVQDAVASNIQRDPKPSLEPFHQHARPLVWKKGTTNQLSDLHFTDTVEVAEAVPAGMVEFDSQAFGLNFRDVMVALDQLDETLIGHECAGVITRLGPGIEESGLKVGDRVCGMARGRFASRARGLWTSVAKIPDGTSFEEAAAIPYAYVTAYHGLFDIARIQRGESILIHAAAGAVGQAAIVLAQHVGAEIFVTCSTQVKRDLLIETYKIDPGHIFASRDESFAPRIMKATGGKGVDVVLNSLAGPLLRATWDCIARFGRFVEIGKVDLEAARRLDTSPFGRCASYSGLDILQLSEYGGKTFQRALVESIRICNSGYATPIHPINRFSISNMENAMRQMQTGTHVGKIILVPKDGDLVKIIPSIKAVSLDDHNATYMVTGGLGGIGRSIARWMIEKGARNLLLVSRSAKSHPDAAALTATAQAQGCNLQIRSCDISDENSFMKLIQECASTLPPIRGVINGVMVLDDTVLEKMTYDQWLRAVRPKVEGSLNIHKHLTDLSFYVMLSSLAGFVGHMSQANYAAGNTFQDALALHRTNHNQAAIVLDLGPIADQGFVAEADGTVLERVEKLGTVPVDMETLLRLIETAIGHPIRIEPGASQVLLGIAPWDKLRGDSPIRTERRFGTLRLGSRRGLGPGLKEAGADAGANPTAAILQALSKEKVTMTQATAIVMEAVVRKLAAMFNMAAKDIDAELPLSRYGVDSLVAVELRNWLSRVVRSKVSIFDILQSKSLNEFGALVSCQSELVKGFLS
ncbi:hypothetical protein SCAR479_08264 [Seiridium cardinale]|uniref:Polyketide synthase n=1 Tax=Seiridium cardinale TaxID=138064 RepID=A0ABR2XMF5_9PEZI